MINHAYFPTLQMLVSLPQSHNDLIPYGVFNDIIAHTSQKVKYMVRLGIVFAHFFYKTKWMDLQEDILFVFLL